MCSKKNFILFFASFFPLLLFAQPCPEHFLAEGKEEYKKEKYQIAKKDFELGLHCIGGVSEMNKTELQKWFDKSKYVDSLVRIINASSKIIDNSYHNNSIEKYVNQYLNSATELGDFYCNEYKNGTESNTSKALKYYSKVTDCSDVFYGPTDTKLGELFSYDDPLTITKKIIAILIKTGDMYASGIGTEKNINKAMNQFMAILSPGAYSSEKDNNEVYSRFKLYNITTYTLLHNSISCNEGDSILFKYGRVLNAYIPENVKKILKEFCNKITKGTCIDFNVRVTGTIGSSDYRTNNYGWDITNNIIQYMVGLGVQENRIIFSLRYNDIPTIAIVLTKEKGLTEVPAPHPMLRKN